MNATSVWPGHNYAYVTVVRRNRFPTSAQNVKVQSVRRVKMWGKEREDTLATVEFEGGTVREVNVRNLYDFWDSYMDEKNHRDAQYAKQRAEQEERYRQQEQERLAKIAKQNKIKDNLAHRLGIDPAVVEINHARREITIRLQDVQFLED